MASQSIDKKDSKKDAKADIKGLEDDKDAHVPVKLTSKDGKSFTVERKYAMISALVAAALDNGRKETDVEVPLPGVMGDTLELIVQYMKEHKGVEPPIIEKPLRSKIMKEVCAHKWDAEFIDKIGEERKKLYTLILGANYLDVKSLLHLACAKTGSLIKGQPLEKVKEILNPDPTAEKKKNSDTKDEKAPSSSSAAAASSTAAAAAAAVDTSSADSGAPTKKKSKTK